jgi:hypothetical protein
MLEEAGLPGRCIELEITEAMLIDKPGCGTDPAPA